MYSFTSLPSTSVIYGHPGSGRTFDCFLFQKKKDGVFFLSRMFRVLVLLHFFFEIMLVLLQGVVTLSGPVWDNQSTTPHGLGWD
jgi:hypothetical protein